MIQINLLDIYHVGSICTWGVNRQRASFYFPFVLFAPAMRDGMKHLTQKEQKKSRQKYAPEAQGQRTRALMRDWATLNSTQKARQGSLIKCLS